MADTVTTTHPIRGLLWGLLMGIGLALVLVITKVIYLDLVTMIIVVVAVVIAGVLWGIFGPAKTPKGPPPIARDTSAPPEASRFDDFESPEDSALHRADSGAPLEAATATAVEAGPATETTSDTTSDTATGPAGEDQADEES